MQIQQWVCGDNSCAKPMEREEWGEATRGNRAAGGEMGKAWGESVLSKTGWF